MSATVSAPSLRGRLRCLPRRGLGWLRRRLARVPVLSKALRYAKRAVFLPWNFHKFFASYAELRGEFHELREQARAHAALTAQALNLALESLQRQEALARTVEERTRDAADRLEGLVRSLMDALGQGVTDELTQLREQHADCFDHLVELCRDQSRALRELEKLAPGLRERGS